MPEPLDPLRERFPESGGWAALAGEYYAIVVGERAAITLKGDSVANLIAAWNAALASDPKVKALVQAIGPLRERCLAHADPDTGGDVLALDRALAAFDGEGT